MSESTWYSCWAHFQRLAVGNVQRLSIGNNIDFNKEVKFIEELDKVEFTIKLKYDGRQT